MRKLSLWMGMGAVLLLAASAQGADTAAGDEDSSRVAQAAPSRGSFGFRNFEGRFGDVERGRRARPQDGGDKDGAKKKPEVRHRDGDKHRSAKPNDGAAKKPGDKPAAGAQHRRPQWAGMNRPQWQSRWRPNTASFHGRTSGRGGQGKFTGRHQGFGGHYAAASWRGHHRHEKHGQMGRQGHGYGRGAFASMHGGRHKHGAMGRHGYARYRGHGQMGRHGQGRQQWAQQRHRGHHGRYAMQHGRHGHHGHFACRGHRGHGGWQHGIAMRGQRGPHGRNFAMARTAAVRWQQRGFAPGRFNVRVQGPQSFAVGPFRGQQNWQGRGPIQIQGRATAGGPQELNRIWATPVRPAAMPGRGPQARGGGEGAKLSELSARIDRLQRELERLRREVR